MTLCKGHDQVVEFLIEAGVNLHSYDKQERGSIHWAAVSGHIHVVQLLLHHGAEVNCTDRNRVTPIHFAAAYGYNQVKVGHFLSYLAKSRKSSENFGF